MEIREDLEARRYRYRLTLRMLHQVTRRVLPLCPLISVVGIALIYWIIGELNPGLLWTMICVPPLYLVLQYTFALPARIDKVRWIFTDEKIKLRGGSWFSTKWSHITKFSVSEIDELPGYSELQIMLKNRVSHSLIYPSDTQNILPFIEKLEEISFRKETPQ